jgi:hypothetical protein
MVDERYPLNAIYPGTKRNKRKRKFSPNGNLVGIAISEQVLDWVRFYGCWIIECTFSRSF